MLVFCGLVTSFGNDAMVNWFAFLKIVAMFILRKEVMELRVQFLLEFLGIKGPESLQDKYLLRNRLAKFRFNNRKELQVTARVQAVWDTLRHLLQKR